MRIIYVVTVRVNDEQPKLIAAYASVAGADRHLMQLAQDYAGDDAVRSYSAKVVEVSIMDVCGFVAIPAQVG